jgi:exonuclease VII large subunit
LRSEIFSFEEEPIYGDGEESSTKALRVLDPAAVLRRGYALARKNGKYIVSAVKAKNEKSFDLSFADGDVSVTISST